MNWLDIVIIIIIAIGLFDGWRHGFLHFIFDFIGIGLGIVVAALFYRSLADRLDFIEASGVAEIVAFSVICAIVGIAAAIVGHRTIEPRIKRVIPSQANRSVGMILGFVIGAALSIVIVLLLDKFVVLPHGSPLDETSAVRRAITTALDESIVAGYILEWFGSFIQTSKLLSRGLTGFKDSPPSQLC